MSKHKVFVYGTLRPGASDPVDVPGELRDLGSYPGAKLMGADFSSSFKAEVVEVTDSQLDRLDRYEGYHPNDHKFSLYLRVPYLDGWIYTYNHDMSTRPMVTDGDWLKHKKSSHGAAASYFLGGV